MNIPSLYNALREGDIDSCYRFADKASQGREELVSYLNTMLHFSVSINWDNEIVEHPVVVINSIKNILSDNLKKPSKPLLYFCANILNNSKIRDDNKYLDQIKNNSTRSSIFVGDLEDAIQSNDWENTKLFAGEIYLASDRSRAVIDTIVDIGLQNIEINGVFIFHLLRAFHFKQEKTHIWSYACCLISMLKLTSILEPHSRKNIEPDNIFDHIVSQNNFDLLIKYMAVFRIWNGEYVKQNSYNREISHWISNKKSLNNSSKTYKPIAVENDIGMNYIEIAEKIIAQEKPSRTTAKITLVEAIRHINKIKPGKDLSYYTSRLI
tara:strand:- start:16 stop:984 length:969 start_codon:yes stop_codon:yes gene_type:complete